MRSGAATSTRSPPGSPPSVTHRGVRPRPDLPRPRGGARERRSRHRQTARGRGDRARRRRRPRRALGAGGRPSACRCTQDGRIRTPAAALASIVFTLHDGLITAIQDYPSRARRCAPPGRPRRSGTDQLARATAQRAWASGCGEQVGGGEAGPLAVAAEQLGRVAARLGPAAEQRRAELDQAEVADRAVGVGAQARARDHARRPQPQARLGAQPVDRSLRRDGAQPLEVERPRRRARAPPPAAARAPPARPAPRSGGRYRTPPAAGAARRRARRSPRAGATRSASPRAP